MAPSVNYCGALVDASFKDGLAGIAVHFVCGGKNLFVAETCTAANALEAELLAIRLALSKAKDAGFVGLSVFSDCQVAVKALTSGDAPPDRNSLPTFFSCV